MPNRESVLMWMGLTVGMFMIITMCTKRSFGYTPTFSASETHLLYVAYEEGQHINKPEILQAILLNETVAGRYGRLGDTKFRDWKLRSYGVMQIRYATAFDILSRKFPKYINKDMSIEEEATLLSWLTIDDKFNIHVARMIIEELWNKYRDWEYVLLAYNVGIGNIRRNGLNYDPNNYLPKAIYHLEHTIPIVNQPIKYRESLENMTKWEISRLTKHLFVKNYSLGEKYHTIKKGDTFSKLAQKYLGSWQKWYKIQNLNLHLEPTKLEIGEVIRIW
jgi:hypothetical protein